MRALLHHGANGHAQGDEGKHALAPSLPHAACSPGQAPGPAVAIWSGRAPNRDIVLRSTRGNLVSPPEQIGRAQQLLAAFRSTKYRARRHRCWLVMLDSRASLIRTAGCNSGDVSGGSSNAADGQRESGVGSKVARIELAGRGYGGEIRQAGNGGANGSGGRARGLARWRH